MESRSIPGSSGSKGASNWICGAVVAGIVVIGLWLTVDAMVKGPNVWELVEGQYTAEIEQEDHAVCARFEMAPGTEAFEPCARELAQVRYLQTERLRRSRF